jgi:fructose-1,6-bisphosphatase
MRVAAAASTFRYYRGKPVNQTCQNFLTLCCKQGEEQKKLDVVTNDVIKRALKFTGKVGVIASEEEDAPVFNKDAYR